MDQSIWGYEEWGKKESLKKENIGGGLLFPPNYENLGGKEIKNAVEGRESSFTRLGSMIPGGGSMGEKEDRGRKRS